MANRITQPRLRVNRSASLSLSTNWQKIDFNGTSSRNINTFGKDPVSGNPMVMWDSNAKLFRLYDIDQNMLCFLNMTTTTSLLTVRATLQYRCVIPNGISAGVNDYFPFPEEGGYADAMEVTILAAAMNHNVQQIPFYLQDTIRSNGFWIVL